MYTRAAKNGKWGEIYAVRMLRETDEYEIVACDYRIRGGEVDIIAIHGQVMAFIEVKTRTGKMIAQPREWVTEEKRRKLIYTAKHFLTTQRSPFQPRFDVIEVVLDDSVLPPKVVRMNHIKDAFRCEDEIF